MKVVLAYSGGLDTSVILTWLIEEYDAEVIAYTGDVGQRDEDLDAVREAALRTGATDAIVEDLKGPFAERFILPALRANAVYESSYLMGTALARPVLAEGLVEAAERLGAQAIAHGWTGGGLHVESDADVTLIDVEVSGNDSGNFGGGGVLVVIPDAARVRVADHVDLAFQAGSIGSGSAHAARSPAH